MVYIWCMYGCMHGYGGMVYIEHEQALSTHCATMMPVLGVCYVHAPRPLHAGSIISMRITSSLVVSYCLRHGCHQEERV